ncbi:MAG: HAD hydrolase-like protein [Ruthenibacterium sp.]
MKKIRAVLFDMDGLMFDTQRLWDKAWKQAGEACGVPMGEEQIAPIRGRSLADRRRI